MGFFRAFAYGFFIALLKSNSFSKNLSLSRIVTHSFHSLFSVAVAFLDPVMLAYRKILFSLPRRKQHVFGDLFDFDFIPIKAPCPTILYIYYTYNICIMSRNFIQKKKNKGAAMMATPTYKTPAFRYGECQ